MLLLAVLGAGCVTRFETRQHTLDVLPTPSDARVSMRDREGRVTDVGRGAQTVTLEYQTRRRELSPWCWAIPAAGTVGFFGGFGLVAAGMDSDRTPLGGILLTALAGSAFAFGSAGCGLGWLVTKQQAPEPVSRPVTFEAAREGWLPVSTQALIPAERRVRLALEPGAALLSSRPAPVAEPAPVAARPAFVPGVPQPSSYALVVGIERYRDVTPPAGARADAEEFARLALATLGLPEENVRTILDERATRTDVEKELAWLRRNTTPGSRIYFFFSGHGASGVESGAPYLVPYDGDPGELDTTGLSLAGVLRAFQESPAAEVVAFVDSCFSGSGGRSVLPPGTRPLLPVREEPVPSKVSLFSSATGVQVSGTSPEGRGLFSTYVMQGLGEARADVDGDGRVTLRELEQWVTPRVVRAARRASREQSPQVVTGEGRDPSHVVLAVLPSGH